ncbi:acyl-CoA dehydrogenase family protein [Kaistella sp. G5-32]|uniref:Acyl-CoA dehydrogenase family protein n=1 Tax=Kaistella gelatinilytica TaxID=2787636 RepID=A0ABS0F928_9FLAO|nr:acyl-CoA dehydrogenase family protein [Kaistella gelatinilytica]MBF8456150.1 acyl-CoA dehydrogenase family protein [Kaistella gelatinilytica]
MTHFTQNQLAKFIRSAQKIGDRSLSEATKADKVDSFPKKTLKKIIKSKLLEAAIPVKYGGQNLGLSAGTNLALLTILKNIGSGNLVMGRVLEGHINAQILIDQFGTKKQKKRFAKDALNGHLFGVWNTQAKDGTFLKFKKNGNYHLNGAKTFATGCGFVSRPLITAALPDGSWQMAIVKFDQVKSEIDASWWNPMGMRSSRSYKINFFKAKIPQNNLLGKAGDYYRQPCFSGGAIRFAAIQLGAAERLLSETIKYLQQLQRTEDPFQKTRIGEMTIAVATGNLWLKNAAAELDLYHDHPTEKNSQKLLCMANMMRTAIEKICLEVMELCAKSVGARGLNSPYHFERIIRDLTTYLRQPAPDAALAEVGRYSLQTKNLNTVFSKKIKKNIL